jgi:predicted AAA+ superfamily ATPase
VQQFAKTYKQSILLNLEKASDRDYFERYHDVKIIKEALFLSLNISSDALGKTLLFIDEIQESPKAIHLLRYFYEELPDLHVIAAGSLLEFVMRKVPGFPVGRVEYLYLHPLNFAEYLEAIGHRAVLEQLNQVPVKLFAHKTLLSLFNRYAIIGGMPEVISVYLQNNSMADLPRVYESIWGTYQNDVEKYTDNESGRMVIKHIMSTAHLYVDQRIKFQNFGNSNYRSREVGEALRNLDQANVIRLIYPTTDLQPPVKPDLKKSPRLQFLDTGIVNHTLGIQSQMLALENLSTAFRGAIIPHLITQEILSLNTISNYKPNFWVREKSQSSSEVDLVITHEDQLIPIEIKSGSTGTLKSLHQFTERANHPYTIRLCAGEFSVERTKTPAGKPYLLMNMPYYLGTKIQDYIAYFLNNY